MKTPVNLTIHSRVITLARRIMTLRGHASMSAFVEELVRDEYERRNGKMQFADPKTTPRSQRRSRPE